MHITWLRIALVPAVALAGMTGCAKEETATKKKDKGASLVPIEGTTIKRIVLVPKAAERLGIDTVKVREATPQEMAGIVPAGQGGRTAVPYAAVLYDKTGATFTYTNPKDLDYVRQAITVEGIKENVAVLTAGPPPGTGVVTVGGAELYGVETGVGK